MANERLADESINKDLPPAVSPKRIPIPKFHRRKDIFVPAKDKPPFRLPVHGGIISKAA